MRHLRLVTAADTAPGSGTRDDVAPAAAVVGRPARPARPARPVPVPGGDDLPLLYVPARLLLALAGRCSCAQCCTAYAEHRPEPHDPRRRGEDGSAGLRAI